MFKLFKNLHIFHTWGKWSGVIKEPWTIHFHFTGIEKTTVRLSQERTCSHCGKYQKRYIR